MTSDAAQNSGQPFRCEHQDSARSEAVDVVRMKAMCRPDELSAIHKSDRPSPHGTHSRDTGSKRDGSTRSATPQNSTEAS